QQPHGGRKTMITEELEEEFDEQLDDTEPEEDFDTESEAADFAGAGEVDHADLLKMYMREASRAPMLNAAGEAAGAKRIERARRRLTTLLARSPLVAAYCLHLQEVLQSGQEVAGDLIENAPGFDATKPATLGVHTETAFSGIEAAYQDLLEPQKPKASPTRRGSRRRNRYPRSEAARRRIRLARTVRAFVFTPATERQLVQIIQEGAQAARAHAKNAKNAGSKPDASDGEAPAFDVAAATARLLAAGVVTHTDMLKSARQVNAAFSALSHAKQSMTEAN